jgi:cytochrome d ubiquinol oxidase subunit I
MDELAAMTSPFVAHQITHMLAAAYMSTGFAVAAIHAWILLRRGDTTFHRKAFNIALAVAIPFTLVQPLIGDFAGKQVAKYQPAKLAAMEQHFETQANADLRLGPLTIPGGLSFIAFGDTQAVVKGLNDFPADEHPPALVRPAFQLMVGLGMYMAAVCALALFLRIRKRRWTASRLLLWTTLAGGPMGFIAIEAGWVVTEVGRQPWVIYGFMKTKDAVTPMPGLVVPFTVFTLLYLFLSFVVIAILRSQIAATVPIRGGDL